MSLNPQVENSGTGFHCLFDDPSYIIWQYEEEKNVTYVYSLFGSTDDKCCSRLFVFG